MTRPSPIRPTSALRSAAPPARRSRRAVLAASLATVLLTAACGGGGGDDGEDTGSSEDASAAESQVAVSGAFGEKPEVTVEAPLSVSESSSWTVVDGDGDEVGPSATTILGLTIVNGETGEVAISTYDQGQAPQEVNLTQNVFPSLVQGVVGQKAKSRVVIASTAEDAYGPDGSPQIGLGKDAPVVIVADILSTDPTDALDAPDGTEEQPPAAAPTLVESDGTPTGFTFPSRKAPTELTAYTLVEGDGPAVEDPDRVRVNYLGAVWGRDTSFDDSYSRGEPADFSVGLGKVIPAWDELLVGVKQGSRVILVCPPDQAYGAAGQGADIPPNSTLVFVVDVLGVG